MHAYRFDSLARRVAVSGSRRWALRSLALATGVIAGTSSGAQALDATEDSVGGGESAAVCPPVRRPTQLVSAAPPFPAFLVAGGCTNPDRSDSFNLIDAGVEDSDRDSEGSAASVGVARSMTTLSVDLASLLGSPHAIVVEAGGTSDEVIACGDVGGVLAETGIAFGLGERNGSGYAGVATLADVDGQTSVAIFLAENLFEMVDAWQGSVIVTTGDVNLRAEPSQDAGIVTVVAEGSTLTVTGPATGEWLPVVVDATGETGYVNANFVELQ